MTDDRILADRIRTFVYQHYVVPAQNAGRHEVEVRTGDVHRDMRLQSRMPAVCSALGAKFEQAYGLRLLRRTGPTQGATVVFRFGIGTGQPVADRDDHQPPPSPRHNEPAPGLEAKPFRAAAVAEGTIFLVSCVGEKRASAAPARDLYVSDWFKKARTFVERTGSPWFILSAEHGLVPAEQVIAPYERTLNNMPIEDRRRWAQRVLAQMRERMPDATRVVFLAGARYREFLVEDLRRRGLAIEIPMEGLGIGEQLSWLGRA
jgi:hypothetical protein